MPPVPLTDRVLMGPGPCNPYPEVAAAFARPLLGPPRSRVHRAARRDQRPAAPGLPHRQPADLPRERHRLGRHGGGVRQRGRAGRRGRGRRQRRVRRADVRRRRRAAAPRWCGSTRRGASRSIRRRCSTPIPRRASIAAVHAETSTGVRNDVACLGQQLRHQDAEALVLVDCVTSLGGIPVEIDGWGVDLAYAGTQKCLGVPPGLAPFTAGDAGRRAPRSSGRSRGTSTSTCSPATSTGEGARAYHHTAPISMIFALHAGLGAAARRGARGVVGPPPPVRRGAAGRPRWRSGSSCSRPRATACPS